MKTINNIRQLTSAMAANLRIYAEIKTGYSPHSPS